MRRVAQQRRAALVPAIERVAVVERPFVVALGRSEQPQQRVWPAGKGFHHLGAVAFLRPGLAGPGVGLDMRDEIDQRAAAHDEVNDVAAWPHIERQVGADQACGKCIERDQSAPAHRPGEPRRLLAEQTLPDDRADAVGADDQVGFDHASVGEARACLSRAGLDLDAAGAEMEKLARQLPAQHLDQVGAMHRQIGRPELPLIHPLAKHLGDDVAAVPGAHQLVLRFETDLRNGGIEPERAKRLDRVGRQRDPGADLADLRRLLVDLDLEVAPVHRHGGGQSANPGTDDGDLRLSWHSDRSRGGGRSMVRWNYRASISALLMSGFCSMSTSATSATEKLAAATKNTRPNASASVASAAPAGAPPSAIAPNTAISMVA